MFLIVFSDSLKSFRNGLRGNLVGPASDPTPLPPSRLRPQNDLRLARHPLVIGEQVPIELPGRRNAAAPSRTPPLLTLKMGCSESGPRLALAALKKSSRASRHTCYSQRNTFAESAV